MTETYHLLASVNLVLGGLVFLLGMVILRENTQQRLNRVVSAMLFFGGFGAVLSALSLLVPAAQPGVNLQQNVAYVWQLFFPTAFVFASVFPEERPFTRRLTLPNGWRSPHFLVLVYAPHLFHFALVLVTTLLGGDKASSASQAGILGAASAVLGVVARLFLSVHQTLFSLVDLVFGIGAVALLIDSWRRTPTARLRAQLRSISLGLAGCLVLYSGATSIPTLVGHPLERGLQAALTTAALTLGSGAIAFAVVRYKFLDAKLIARRGILYALTSAVVIGIYLLVVERVNGMVARAFGVDARVVEPVFLVMALTLFQPVIARLEQSLDQLFLRDPTDYRNVLRKLGRDLQTTIDLDDLLTRSINTLTQALMLRSAYVVALTPEGPIVRSGAGEPLSDEALAGILALIPRLSREEASFRLSDPVDGLRRVDRELLVRKLGVELMVPLRWRGDTLGLVLLGEKLTSTAYTGEDVTLLNALGSQMGVSLQNALLLTDRLRVARLEEELHLAQTIQQSFLRSDFPPLPRCEVHAVNLPSRQVGGDYYDVVPLGDGSFLVAIADVAGKGVPAALLSSMLQASVRTQARSVASVATILHNINELVYRSTSVHQFATFFLARVDATGSRLTFCNAGHNWPLLVRASGEIVPLEKGGLILGILEEITLEEDSVELRQGDRVLFYTDGISEAANRDGELYSDERLGAFVSSLPHELTAREITERVLAEIERHLGSEEAQDDRTLVVLRVTEPERAPRVVHEAPAEVVAR